MRLAFVLAFAAVVEPSLAHAQAAVPAVPTSLPAASVAPTVAASDSAMRRMRTVLRQLASAEEGYYAAHGTYTTDVSTLGLYDFAGFRAGRTAWVAVSSAGGRSWSAESRHVALKGKSCVMYIGDPTGVPGGVPTTQSGHMAAEQGAPTCDEP